MRFTPIDLQTWPRGQMFYYFSKMAPTGYSITVQLDATDGYHVKQFLHDPEEDIRSFAQYL